MNRRALAAVVTAVTVMVGGLAAGTPAGAAAPQAEGQIVFYEGNNATQNIVHTTNDRSGQDFAPRQNDEARSVKLVSVRAGATITVYDSPSKSKNDDYTIIHVKRLVNTIVVGTFEQNRDDANVRVNFVRNNGLDGKVSRVTVS